MRFKDAARRKKKKEEEEEELKYLENGGRERRYQVVLDNYLFIRVLIDFRMYQFPLFH